MKTLLLLLFLGQRSGLSITLNSTEYRHCYLLDFSVAIIRKPVFQTVLPYAQYISFKFSFLMLIRVIVIGSI